MSTEPASPLRGRTVLVTRPAHQASVLVDLIEQAGGRCTLFPAIAIEPPADPSAAAALLHEIGTFDLVVFVSANAVEQAFMLAPGLAKGVREAFAIGAATARALHAHGVTQVTTPEDAADSEALLRLPQLQTLHGKDALIVSGESGRGLLAETLAERGAQVRRAECYRRARPSTEAGELIAQWQAGAIDAVVAMSTQTLDNLWELLGERGRELLLRTPVFVPHERIASAAMRRGIAEVAITDAGDEESYAV
jgi:uroporphyrinogen-III synthase